MTDTKNHDMQLIISLREAGSADRTLVGSKAQELGILLEKGHSVPGGFVITTEAAGLAPDGLVPASVRDALEAALDTFEGPVALRSSAVAEDLGHASYAGQYETVLNVSGLDAGLAALQHCWESARTSSVEAYRADHGDDDSRIAVIIQEMVPATAAGATFTANPVSGADETVIEAVEGLGDALMAGDVTPERWVIEAAPILESEAPEGPVLTAAQVSEIAAECRSIANEAGEPLDIEWALDGDRLRILQARPITALPQKPEVVVPRKQTWVRSDAYFPSPITPLAFSAWLPHHTLAFSVVTAYFGLPFERVDHRHWYGRVYDRLVPVGEVKTDHPLPPLPILKVLFRLPPPLRKRHSIAATAAAEDRPMAAITAWEEGGRDTLRSRTRELRLVDRASLTDHQLADHLDEAMEQILRAGIDHFTLSFAGMFILTGQLGMLMEELLGWPPEQVLDLLQGYGEASRAQGMALDELTAAIGNDDDARRLLSTNPAELVDHPGPGGDSLRQFLDTHGHSLVAPSFGDPTWAEDPTPLLRMVAARIDETPTQRDPRQAAHDRETEALAAIESPADRERFAEALRRARVSRPYGDETETDVGDVLAVVRYITVESGRRLHSAGRISSQDDLLLLSVDELAAALRGDPVPTDLDRRRAEHRWALANPTPQRFGRDLGDPPPPEAVPAKARAMSAAAMWTLRLFQPPPVEADSDGIRGLPASPGRATGPVRIIQSPAEFDRVRPGDILVCHHTMAAWSPIFPVIAGIVTEHGGPLSHPGTLAREYGLPAVLSVADATTLMSDGDIITIDGATGRVLTAEEPSG